MRRSVVLALLVSACSSAPSPERSAHADGPPAETPAVADPAHADGDAAPAPEAAPPAARGEDVPAAELDALRQRLGCNREGPPRPGSHGVACGLLGRFAAGRAPRWQAGNLAGVVLSPDAEQPDVAQPALLAVRGTGANVEVAWGRLLPGDPRQATELAAMEADVIEGRAPSFAPAPWPGLTWSRPTPTRGQSAELAAAPRILARSEGDATIVLVWDHDAPLVAVHRAPAGAR